jgi:hypothetical protein
MLGNVNYLTLVATFRGKRKAADVAKPGQRLPVVDWPSRQSRSDAPPGIRPENLPMIHCRQAYTNAAPCKAKPCGSPAWSQRPPSAGTRWRAACTGLVYALRNSPPGNANWGKTVPSTVRHPRFDQNKPGCYLPNSVRYVTIPDLI